MSVVDDLVTNEFRVVVKRQSELWEEGLRAGRIFELQKKRHGELIAANEDEEEEAEVDGKRDDEAQQIDILESGYGGGKWGKYLRAPDLYFSVMRTYGNRFVPLGEIADIRFGVKSGCDKFFMPHNVSSKYISEYDERSWKNVPLRTHCGRKEVASGKVILIEDGMGVVHPIESEYLQPEVHSLMNVNRPRINRDEINRLVLMVSEPLEQLKGTYVEKYLRYGEKTTFSSKKSKAVPIPRRATCASRPIWYDLTGNARGQLIWPKAQQYRHIVVFNEERHIVNCNLYDVSVFEPKQSPPNLTAAVLNSTLVNFVKTYYGRYAGTEGNLKTEVVDVNLIEVPDPRLATKDVRRDLLEAFNRLCERDTMPMLEEAFIKCHSSHEATKLATHPIELPNELKMEDRRDLDLAVFELIGVTDLKKREILCDQLYEETARHYRNIRIVEIQKQEQRAGVSSDRIGSVDLAADIWDALAEAEREPLTAWLANRIFDGQSFDIPGGKPHLHSATDMFNANTVHFTSVAGASKNASSIEFPSRGHAELAALLASHEIRGVIKFPRKVSEAASLLREFKSRCDNLTAHFTELAQSRTDDQVKVFEIVGIIFHWIAVGRH